MSPGVIVRYGYPRDCRLSSHEHLTSFNLALRNHPEIKNERDSLLDQLKLLPKNSDRRPFVSKHLTRIRNLLREEERAIAKQSQFVATTVSKATIDDAIYYQEFDVVIFDEASMAYIPQVVFAASLAKKHFICIGDFYQLPSIVQNDEGSHLNADIFEYCYVSMAVERGLKHKWMCLLDTQYRMHSDIANFASDYMYHGLIKTASSVDEMRNDIVVGAPKSGLTLGLVDTAGYMSVCTTASNGSRVNVLSAFISCFLALKVAEKFEVGIISPYNAQSRLIRAITRDVAQNNTSLLPITSSTVHQFQGSEKDVIIFDTVDSYRMPCPGVLLTSQQNNSANRLFNVAMTRAKGKFLAVANASYMKKGLANSLRLKNFISNMSEGPYRIKGEDIFAEPSLANESCLKLYQNKQADSDFLNDITNAEKEIRIDIPGNTSASNVFIDTLCGVLKEAESRGVKIFIRAENVCELPEKLKKISSENRYVYDPIVVIDKKVVWFGMPESNANFIINNHVQKTQYRPIFRIYGNYAPKIICSLLQLNQNDNPISKTNNYSESDNLTTYIYRNVKCPTCHSPMKLSKNKSDTFYLRCSYGGRCKTEYVTVELVNNYLKIHKKDTIKCSVDGTPLKAFLGKKGVYIQCLGSKRHYFRLDEV